MSFERLLFKCKSVVHIRFHKLPMRYSLPGWPSSMTSQILNFFFPSPSFSSGSPSFSPFRFFLCFLCFFLRLCFESASLTEESEDSAPLESAKDGGSVDGSSPFLEPPCLD